MTSSTRAIDRLAAVVGRDPADVRREGPEAWVAGLEPRAKADKIELIKDLRAALGVGLRSSKALSEGALTPAILRALFDPADRDVVAVLTERLGGAGAEGDAFVVASALRAAFRRRKRLVQCIVGMPVPHLFNPKHVLRVVQVADRTLIATVRIEVSSKDLLMATRYLDLLVSTWLRAQRAPRGLDRVIGAVDGAHRNVRRSLLSSPSRVEVAEIADDVASLYGACVVRGEQVVAASGSVAVDDEDVVQALSWPIAPKDVPLDDRVADDWCREHHQDYLVVLTA